MNYSPKDLLEKQGAFCCKDIVSKEMAHYLTSVLLRKYEIQGKQNDSQVDSLAIIDHDLFLETVQELIWPKLEMLLETELLPTYAYSRLYTNGNVLEPHKDRSECEISVSVQLGKSHNYCWPLFAGSQRFDLAEGDGMVYRGCDVEHYRKPCDGPEGYYSGQVFFHFVLKDGKYSTLAGDSKVRNTDVTNLFKKHRSYLMETK